VGRKLRRVPLDFEWPLKRTWKGYEVPLDIMDEIPCPTCQGENKTFAGCGAEGCCFGSVSPLPSGRCWRPTDPPEGPGYQMWETTSDGSPISPVFATPQELARWLADSGASVFGKHTATYEEWLEGILKQVDPKEVRSGSPERP
jgi:hypothetical protein